MVSALAVVLVVGVALTILLGVRAAAHRAGMSAEASRGITVRAALILTVWLAVPAAVAASGALADFEAKPPRLMLLVLGSFVVCALSTRGATFRRLLDATPRWWPLAIQTMRVPIELGLWSLFVSGRLPVQMTFEGRNYDVLVGLSAPLMAWAVARDRLGKGGLIAWHVASLALLANIVGIAITSMPAPLHLDWPGIPNVIVAVWPFVWLPTFLVPVALFGHVLSLRQLRQLRST